MQKCIMTLTDKEMVPLTPTLSRQGRGSTFKKGAIKDTTPAANGNVFDLHKSSEKSPLSPGGRGSG